MTKNEINQVVKESLGSILEIEPEEIDDDEDFFHLGVSSIQALKVVNILRKKLDIEINPVAMFEFQTVNDITEYLCNEAN